MAVFLHPDKMRDVENARECFEQVIISTKGRPTYRHTHTHVHRHTDIHTHACTHPHTYTHTYNCKKFYLNPKANKSDHIRSIRYLHHPNKMNFSYYNNNHEQYFES